MRSGFWLPFCVFAFFVISFALHPQSPFHTHHLADPDDYMRLNQVGDWLRGQDWHDLSVPRLSPDAHTIVHWSRLIDMPIAFIAMPFIPFFGLNDALLIASLIVPLVYFGLLLRLLPALTSFAIDDEHKNIACIFVLFAPILLFNYTPGRVDHHGAQALIAGFGLLSLGNIITQYCPRLFAVLAALFFACGFWIGAEALPWAILFIACLASVSAFLGGKIARDAAIFGLCLSAFTAALIPIALPASEFSSRALSWFSPAYVIFAALSGAVLILGWALSHYTKRAIIRVIFYKLLAIAALCAFFAFIPSALHGPFADYDAFDATTALDNISEAQPLIDSLHINRFIPYSIIPFLLTIARLLLLPFIGFVFCLWSAHRAKNAKRFVWIAHSVFLGAAFALTLFWQIRVAIFMELFAIVPITALLCIWWKNLQWRLWDRKLFWAEIAVFLSLGFLPVIFLPALFNSTPVYPDLLLFPAARPAAQCPLEPVIPFLNETDGLGATARTFMNTSDTGPQILFATRHKVIAGNFDVAGNADAFAFFNAIDDAKARQAAAKWHADFVILCRIPPNIYLGRDYAAASHIGIKMGVDGMLHLTNTDKTQPLISRLVRGQTPVWLKKIEIPVPSDYLIFQIQPEAKKK